LLRTLATAVTLARRDHYPDNDSAALGYLIGTWGRRLRASGPPTLAALGDQPTTNTIRAEMSCAMSADTSQQPEKS
jgi:hypothetical protein